MMKKILDLFYQKIHNDLSESRFIRFQNELAYINYSRFKLVAPIVVFIFIVLIFFDIDYYYKNLWSSNPGYRFLFIFHILITVFLLFMYMLTFIKPLESPEDVSSFHHLHIKITLFFSSILFILITMAYVYINRSVGIFLGGIFSLAAIFILPRIFNFLLYLMSSSLLLIFLFDFQKTTGALIQVQISSTISFSIIAFVLSNVLYRYQYNDFSNRCLIREQKEKLQEMAMKDPLTGLYNRRGFQEISQMEYARVIRYAGDLSLLIFDIDHFKKINDKYGHPIGDSLLIELTSLVTNNIRETDSFIRWGGEEFIIIVPGTNSEGMVHFAEKIRSLVENFKPSNIPMVTISIGYTTYQKGDSMKNMTERADSALYNAKLSGRNRVCYL